MGKKRRKKKKSAGRIFLEGFAKSLLIMGMLFLTGFASYKVSLFYFHERGVSGSSKASSVIQELYGAVEAEDISKNLIYSIENESGKLKGMVLEVFNTYTGNMDYITIPANTELTISNELYEKLLKAGCEAPQIIKLSSIHKYFSEDTMYEYGELLLNDLLGIDISYYTVMEPEVFEQIFEKTERKEVVQGAETAVVQTVELWTLKESWCNEWKAVEKTEEAIKAYMETSYEKCKSNLSVRSKKKYATAYLKWDIDYTYYHIVPGVAEEKTYEVIPEDAKKLLEQVLGNSTYTEQQNGTIATLDAVSKNGVIQILNASQINGLAAQYKTTLEAQGYTVDSIGNYTGQMQTMSSILVREEGLGSDLLLYLENAQIRVSPNLPAGIDIQIVLGTDADR